LTINNAIEPRLSRLSAREIPESAISLQANVTQKMPTRNLLDILVNIERRINFTRHFGPLSGYTEDRAGRGTLSESNTCAQ
jgi:hypothetical protein